MDSSKFTEQRWGNRFDMALPANLRMMDGSYANATIRNASVSGALVETGVRPSLKSRVSLSTRGSGTTLDACVVRVDPKGIALEWLDTGRRKSASALLSTRFPRSR